MESSRDTSCVTSVPLLDIARENEPLMQEIEEAMVAVARSGRFVLGPPVEQLESEIAHACGVEHAVGCASGSDALLLCLMALGIQAGDEVIVPSFTFFATASAVWRLGAVPIFVDIDAETFNVDDEQLESLITTRTKAIIPVHLFGLCANMAPIMEIANRHGVQVIEDSAQSIGALYDNQPAGSLGLAGCLSFYPTKNLGGFGDAGMITTHDASFADELRLLRGHGMRPRYLHQAVGINSRLDSIQAAVLSIKMKHLGEWTAMRQRNASRYQTMFEAAGLTDELVLPTEPARCTSAWNQFTVRIPMGRRDALREHLRSQNIGSEIYYPLPVHLQPCFAGLGVGRGALPVTEQAADEVLSLPVFPHITVEEQQRVVESIAEFYLNPPPPTGDDHALKGPHFLKRQNQTPGVARGTWASDRR